MRISACIGEIKLKNTVAVSIACLAIAGCVSSSYKLSVPPVEDKGDAKYRIINYYATKCLGRYCKCGGCL